MKYSIGIRINREFRAEIDRAWLRKVAKAALRAEGVEDAVELGLVVTDDAAVRALNRDYRGLDRTTDVLSFALEEEGEERFVDAPDGLRHLGEVVIAWPQCRRQALRGGHGAAPHLNPLSTRLRRVPGERKGRETGERDALLVRNEAALLVAHGVLHLLGWEHDTPARRRKMWARQREILGGLGVSLPTQD
jgi:probable rRNA maturation factor